MEFNLAKSLEILERTPAVVRVMLSGLSDEWIYKNEGPGTWSPHDVVAHLLHCEISDWMPRITIILESSDKKFPPFDPAGNSQFKDRSLSWLLDEFAGQRERSLQILKALRPGEKQLELKGIHPKFGDVTLSQLLATWTVHDLNHIAQISRVMGKQYKDAVGPWIEFLRILK